MNDMKGVIVPDSSQINADDLQTGPITVKITAVKIKGGKEQPVDIILDGMEKVYRPCKSMCRCLVAAWGADAAKYVGRSLTLYCDPTVKWGGMAVGGLRISHMSHIDSAMTMALTVTRANKKPFTVKPLNVKAQDIPSKENGSPPSAGSVALAPNAAASQPNSSAIGNPADAGSAAAPTADEALLIKAREFAECGTEKYSRWWAEISTSQRRSIGADRHAEFKKIAEAA